MRKPIARLGKKVWLRVKIEEGCVSGVARRMTQGIFVGHHDRWEQFGVSPNQELYKAKVGRDSL